MSEEKDKLLVKVGRYKQESENLRSRHDTRWAKNLKLIKGIFTEMDSKKSVVRNRHKMFFRKIWATVWRLVASFYQAFLRDTDTFSLSGRDMINDPIRAKVLQKVVEFRNDVLMREHSLFLQHIWALQNICNLGWGVGKFSWQYDEELGIDGPEYTIYPNEQVYPDLSAETKDKMRYIIFVNYLTYADMEERKYKNLKDTQPTGMKGNQLRSTRNMGHTDPLQDPGEKEYPAPGSIEDDVKDTMMSGRYEVWECFYKDKGKIKFCVTNADNAVLVEEKDSPYGNSYNNVVMGVCLTEPHKLIPEGFPEPLEGPQESYNFNLNTRKDNVALAMTRQTVVSRYGGVDVQSLMNRRPGAVTQVDDINAVKTEDYPDVTRSAYLEAQQDDMMMQEMSGVTGTHEGMSESDTATQASINLSQGNAKIDLYVAIVGETYFRDFYNCLTNMVQKFETDEVIMRIANEQIRKENPFVDDIYDFGFHADVRVDVGLATIGREAQIRNTLLVMDRAIMANQSMAQMLQTGAMPPSGPRMVDITAFFEDLLPKLGKKETARYIVPLAMGPPPGKEGGNGSVAGLIQPQPGGREALAPVNELQAGNLGGGLM